MKQTKSAGARQTLLRRGAANRGRTGTESLPKDFKSFVSAYSTIAAFAEGNSIIVPQFTRKVNQKARCVLHRAF